MSFLADPIGNISGAIHDVGKSSIGKMAEAAAIAYFLGPAGEGLMEANTALGVGGGLTTLLNGGSLQDSLKSGVMAYGIGQLTGAGQAIGDTAIPGGAPVGDGVPTPVGGQYSSVADASLQNAVTPTPSDLPVAPPVNSAPVTPVPGVNAPPAPPPIDPNAGRAFYDQLGPDGKPLSVTKSLLQSYGNAGLPTQLGIAALAAAGLKAATAPQKLNAPNMPDTRYVKYYNYAPMGGYSYQGQTPALKAATGGIVALAQGGGVHHYDDGGNVAAATSGYTPGMTAQDVVNQYHLNADQAAQVASNLGYTGDLSGLHYGTPAGLAALDTSMGAATPAQGGQMAIDNATAPPLLGLQALDKSMGAATPAQAGQIAINNATTAPTYTKYSDPAITNYIQTSGIDLSDPNAVNAAIAQAHMDPAAYAAYEKSVANPYAVNTLLNPTAANVTNFDKSLGANPSTGALTDIRNAVVTAQDTSGGGVHSATNVAADAQIAKEMDAWGVNPATMGKAVNMSEAQIQALYNQVNPTGKYSTVPKTPTPTPTPSPTTIPGLGTTTTQNGTVLNTYTPPGSTTPITLNPVNRTTQNVSTPTDIATAPAGALPSGVSGNNAVVNPNGTISQNPTLPNRPAGGYTSVQQMVDAVTAGGGSTGFVPNQPKTLTEFNAQNNKLTGQSKANYDYLMGLSSVNPALNPVTPTGEISKPYQSSVMGMPMSEAYNVSQPLIYDQASHSYKANPNYDAAFSATKDYLGTPQTGLTNQKAIDALGYALIPNSQIYGKKNSDGTYTGLDGINYDADGKAIASTSATSTNSGPAKEGGLMGLAAGGMPNVGHLGGYSDGGRLLRGPGDGVSDSIPATIGSTDPEPARLADGEFVVPARIVSELGNGSTEAGARQLYKMMDRIQKARSKTVGKDRVAANTNAHQYLPA
jgi:hypothetical protein